MVNRIYVEKREGLSPESDNLLADLKGFLDIQGLKGIRILNRYDVEGIEPEVFEEAKKVVFSEPQVDVVYDEEFPIPDYQNRILAVETLPGQFDQRADSSAQCVQLMAGVERPLIRYGKIYILEGDISDSDYEKIKDYLINPVESREAVLTKPETLIRSYPKAAPVQILEGFNQRDAAALKELSEELGLAMDLDDLKFLQDYFKNEEKRDPSITEVRVIDTYWSDHCRHTTFGTHLNNIIIDNPEVAKAYNLYKAAREEVYGEKSQTRPETLMDIATIGSKLLKKRGLLPELDESEEINACSIHVPAVVDGEQEDWLLMFKNETHNHPTEIEPFGGAATCIGGCIRDPLSGRAYVHQAMRVTGGADPRVPFEETIAGRLPQRKIAQTAASGYSSYGNQIGLATGLVDEVYHPGYAAKHLECGAVVGAAPLENVRRERPAPGDVIILLGGRTGRDGIGGATGSSKSHNMKSLTTMASEVQKGNAPEERKLQRLFRNKEITKLIKRCNDFGAGGVSVAIGELADGLEINLDAVRKKYDGLDGTELAISESQERMAVVVAPEDVDKLIEAARQENLEAYEVAVVTESPRMVMTWSGETIADLSRAFLNTNGATKDADVHVLAPAEKNNSSIRDLRSMASNLATGSRRGLTERFDGTIGAGSLMMPYGGKTQRTPVQSMAALLPVLPDQTTEQASIMSYGFNPTWSLEEDAVISPYEGAKKSIITSLAKLVAGGADYRKAYLSLQEFFERLGTEAERWGKPFQALLGALEVQVGLETAAIGGKDSMSGSFMDLNVPPTLISFAIAPILSTDLITPEFKEAGNSVYLFKGSDVLEELKKDWEKFQNLVKEGKVKSAWAVETGGIAEGIMKMSFGNNIGFKSATDDVDWYTPLTGSIVAEISGDVDLENAVKIGETTSEEIISLGDDSASIAELLELNENVLEDVYPTKTQEVQEIPNIMWSREANE